MLLARDERLEDRIVRVLVSEGPQRVDALSLVLKDWGKAAHYKALKKLVDNGILVYSGNRYAISQGWMFSLAGLVEDYLEKSLSQDHTPHLLPAPGASYTWRYSDLRRLNSFASHLIVAAARAESTTFIYSWSPHLWFNLVQENHEQRYYQALRKVGALMFKVIGDDTPLDRETAARLPSDVVTFKFRPIKQFLPRNTYVVVVGWYVITMKLQRSTIDAIDALFARSKSVEAIDLKLFLKIFKHTAVSASLTIECDSAKSSKLSEKFHLYT